MNLSTPSSESTPTLAAAAAADWSEPASAPVGEGGGALPGVNGSGIEGEEEGEGEEEEEEDHPLHHPHPMEVANVNGVLVDLSDADQDLANNNDPNNNAADLNEAEREEPVPCSGGSSSPTGPPSDMGESDQTEPEPDGSDGQSGGNSSNREVTFKADKEADDNPGEGSSGCSETSDTSESPDSRSPDSCAKRSPKYEALKADTLLIMKFMPGKSFDEIHHYLEAHIDNPARVQVVLNEFLEEVEQNSVETASKSSSTFRSKSSRPMEVSASSSGTDSESEINLVKNKSGNGLKAKNSKLNKSSLDPPAGSSGSNGPKEAQGFLRKNRSGRKRLISLDPNLSDEDLDFQSKIAHSSASASTSPCDENHPDRIRKPEPVSKRGANRKWSKKSSKDGGGTLRRQHERSKIQLSEKHLHGPYNFYDHRKRGASSNVSGASSSTSDPFASGRSKGKIEFKALRKDLKDIVDNKPSKSNNSSDREVVPLSGPSDSEVRNESPPVVDLGDLPPSPVVVVDLSYADQSEKRELLGSFTNMFPDTPVEYLVEQADELAGKPAAIERFIMELLARESKPPDYWVPKAERPPDLGFPLGANAVAGPLAPPGSSLANGDEILFPVDGGTYPNQLPLAMDETKERLKMDLLDWQAPPNHFDEALLPVHPGEPIIDLPEEVVEDDALAGPSNEENQEDKNKSRFSTVEILFPRADPEFLHQKVLEFEKDDEAFNRWVNESLENKGNDFPTREAYEKRQEEAELLQKYSREVDVEDILNMYEDPVAFFSDKTRKTSELYEKQAVAQLKREFCYVGVNVIMKIFIQNNKLYYPAFKALKKYNGSKRKTKRMDHECSMPQGIDLNFLKEVQFSRIEGKIEARKQNLEEERQLLIEEGKKSGTLIECSCCYNDECLPQDMLPCKGGHLFCVECVQRASQVAVGEAKTSLTCLGQCDEIFELSTLQKALKANMFSKWLKKISLAEIEKAEIDGLERCPFCEFATIMEFSPEENKVFQCQNPECGKESCRLCKEISHIPLRCEEVEKDAEVRKRTYIENKMTEALVRKCWKCGKPYLKVDGCNKMTCTCGAKMCYLCRKPVTDYTHFYGQGGVSNGKQCPLWSDNNKLHERDVAKGALEAKKNMDEKEPSIKLKHDPTKNIREEAALENEAAAPPPHPLEAVVGGRGGRIRQHIVAQQRMIENQIEALNRMGRGAGGAPGRAGPPGPLPYPMHVNPLGQRRQGGPYVQYNNLINQMGEILELRNQHRMREQELLGREREALEGYRHHHALVPQPPPPQPHQHNPYLGRGGPGGMGPPPAHFHHNPIPPMRIPPMAPPRHVNAPQHNPAQPQPQGQPGQMNPGPNPTLMAGPVLDAQARPRARNDRFDDPPLMFNNYFGQIGQMAAGGVPVGDPPRLPMGGRGMRMMAMGGRGGEQPGEQPVDLRPQPADLRRAPVIVGHPAGPPRPPPQQRDNNRHGRQEGGQMDAGAPAPPGAGPQPQARGGRAHPLPPPPPHPQQAGAPPPLPPRPNINVLMDMYLDEDFLMDDLNPFELL